jgi:hypothetical protein
MNHLVAIYDPSDSTSLFPYKLVPMPLSEYIKKYDGVILRLLFGGLSSKRLRLHCHNNSRCDFDAQWPYPANSLILNCLA